MFPGAKKGDQCLHGGKILTGSPDTTTCDKASARLGDQHDCKSHPPGAPPWPPGPIVTGSSTVFINQLKAARITDKLMCGAPGPPPPGTANPKTEPYAVRPEDGYHALIAGEHELKRRVAEVAEPHNGAVSEIDHPTGVGEGQAPPPPSRPGKGPPSAATITYQGKKGDRQNPYGAAAAQSRRDVQARRLGSGIESPSMAVEAGAGGVSAGLVVGPKGASGETGVAYDEQKNRVTIAIDIGFSLALSVGTRSTSMRTGTPMDAIVLPPCSVIIG